MQALERPSQAEIAERFRRDFKWRFSGPVQHFQQGGFVQPVQHFQDGGYVQQQPPEVPQVMSQGYPAQQLPYGMTQPTVQPQSTGTSYPQNFPTGPTSQQPHPSPLHHLQRQALRTPAIAGPSSNPLKRPVSRSRTKLTLRASWLVTSRLTLTQPRSTGLIPI